MPQDARIRGVLGHKSGRVAIQCKCNGWAGPAERNRMLKLPSLEGVDDIYIEIWRKDDRKPAPRIMCWMNGKAWVTERCTDTYWLSVRARIKEQK